MRYNNIDIVYIQHKELSMNQQKAFTMAEILLSLTIIGVVAAITLPSLMANINEKAWNTQRKALHARMAQAIAMMPSVSGYGTLTADSDGNVTEDSATETFLTEGLAKVLKINNICDNEHLADCGIPTTLLFSSAKTIRIDTGLPTNWLIVIEHGEYRIPSETANWDVLCVKRN